jgi:hypothetical protein
MNCARNGALTPQSCANFRLRDVTSDEEQLRYTTFADGALQERIEFLPGSNPPHCDIWYRIQTSRTKIVFKSGSARGMMDVHGYIDG